MKRQALNWKKNGTAAIPGVLLAGIVAAMVATTPVQPGHAAGAVAATMAAGHTV